ncbi:MAG: LolA family protein [Bdellovibrionota bacterium]
MLKRSSAIIFLLAVLSAPARAALPQLLQDVEKHYSEATTLTALFEQVNETSALKQSKKSSGRIYAKRPDKIRWETLAPDPNILVSDGHHFWFYTPPFDEGEHGQVIEKKSSEVQSRLANALLSGRFSVAKDMKIKQETYAQFTLIPKTGTSGTVEKARIWIDPQYKIITKVVLEHRGGNRSEITLSKIELGPKLGDDMFVFKAPPNTDKVSP